MLVCFLTSMTFINKRGGGLARLMTKPVDDWMDKSRFAFGKRYFSHESALSIVVFVSKSTPLRFVSLQPGEESSNLSSVEGHR